MTKRSLAHYFSLPLVDQTIVKDAIFWTEIECPKCGGQGFVTENRHSCNCRHCDIYEPGLEEDCPRCAGEKVVKKYGDEYKAYAILANIN